MHSEVALFLILLSKKVNSLPLWLDAAIIAALIALFGVLYIHFSKTRKAQLEGIYQGRINLKEVVELKLSKGNYRKKTTFSIDSNVHYNRHMQKSGRDVKKMEDSLNRPYRNMAEAHSGLKYLKFIIEKDNI